MTKKPKKKQDFSSHDRGFTVVLEDLRHQFKTFGEGLENVQVKLEKLDVIDQRLERLEIGFSAFKLAFPRLTTQVQDHERRIVTLETGR